MTEDSLFIANCVINAVLCCTNITLNIVTILALRKTSSEVPKNFKMVLLSLSVADLGVGLLVQPLNIALYAMLISSNNENYNNGTLMLRAIQITTDLLCLASFLNVTVLSADRFLAIYLHLRYHELVTRKRFVAVVISIWVSAAFISLFELWISSTLPYIIGIIFIVCLTATALFSCKIYLVLRRHANHVEEMQVQQAVPQNGEAMENAARHRKSAAAVFYVYLVLLVCYLPNICLILVHITIGSSYVPAIIAGCSDALIYLNSSLNPLIYCWKIKHIRHAIKDVLRNIYPCHD